ncbi:hypothetical protein [Paenarthrobacter sp. NPDC058040]|uniref:hypothetical protein n=1 Tax=unclassified Paenarthrobacter TaxID=2634190 RepID=UPI0036D91E35
MAKSDQDMRPRGGTRLMRRDDRLAETGSHCPTSGIWESIPEPLVRITLHRGDLIPPLNGAAVQWRILPQPTASNRVNTTDSGRSHA